MTVIAALSKHCRLEEETSSEFMQQLKKLATEDKAWFKEQFTKEGVEID